MLKNKLTYIDLFAGCGGLSLGLHNSGLWKGLFAIEKSPDAFKTLEHNLIVKKKHFDWPEWLPQTPLDINNILKVYPQQLSELNGRIDLVVGGPPCQGFSTAGMRKEDDLRNTLIKSYIKFIRVVQPKMIFFENVKGFTQKFDKNKTKGKAYSEYVKNALRYSSSSKDYIGYDVYGKLIDFSEFGVPQKRTRFILVGIRKDVSKNVEPKVFFDLLVKNKTIFLRKKGLKVSVNLEDAISDLLSKKEAISPDTKSYKSAFYNQAESSYQKFLRKSVLSNIPDSHRFAKHSEKTIEKFKYILEHAERNQTISQELKKKFKLKKRTVIPLDSKSATPTITTLPDDYIHYSEPRIFTVREYARLQSFNDWYEFKGKYTTGGKRRTKEVPRYSQIGNAIPPLFGEQSGFVLKQLLINGKS